MEYGLVHEIISDNGPQFASAEYLEFLRNNGVKRTLIAPYHSQSNGIAERMVQTFKLSLNKNNDSIDIDHKICNFLFSYRNIPHCSTNMTPSELFLNRKVRTRLSLVQPIPNNKTKLCTAKQKFYHDSRYGKSLRVFTPGSTVLVRGGDSSSPWLIGTIVDRRGNVNYGVLINGKMLVKHVDQIRLYKTTIDNNVTSTKLDRDTVNADVHVGETSASTHVRETPPNDVHVREDNDMEVTPASPRRSQRVRKPPERLQLSF